ncbi:hypothetical protein N665_0251s0013 [Sinapis alba]|nr:hypothetical protein N665_0251s0013 [Sinapis alba]
MSASVKKISFEPCYRQSQKSGTLEQIILSYDDVDVYFRIKKDVGLRKMMEAFSVKKGEDMSVFAFLFDGVHIKPDQTPNELELEDGDEIQAFLHQIAGVLSFCALS